MFCPKCAAQNVDDAKFCRACGVDIRLVPQALSGQLAGANDLSEFDALGRSRVERGTRKLVRGLGFLFVFLLTVFFFRRAFWVTFWFIIPAISSIAAGVGLLAQHAWRQSGHLPGGIKTTGQLRANETSALPSFRLNEVAPADTAEIVQYPTSVTEGTTRHLGAGEPVAREDGTRSS